MKEFAWLIGPIGTFHISSDPLGKRMHTFHTVELASLVVSALRISP